MDNPPTPAATANPAKARNADSESYPHTPLKSAIYCFALIVILFINIGISYLNLGNFNWMISASCSALMAWIIMSFSMGLRESPGLVKLVAYAGFAWLLILIVLAMADYRTRSSGISVREVGEQVYSKLI